MQEREEFLSCITGFTRPAKSMTHHYAAPWDYRQHHRRAVLVGADLAISPSTAQCTVPQSIISYHKYRYFVNIYIYILIILNCRHFLVEKLCLITYLPLPLQPIFIIRY